MCPLRTSKSAASVNAMPNPMVMPPRHWLAAVFGVVIVPQATTHKKSATRTSRNSHFAELCAVRTHRVLVPLARRSFAFGCDLIHGTSLEDGRERLALRRIVCAIHAAVTAFDFVVSCVDERRSVVCAGEFMQPLLHFIACGFHCRANADRPIGTARHWRIREQRIAILEAHLVEGQA